MGDCFEIQPYRFAIIMEQLIFDGTFCLILLCLSASIIQINQNTCIYQGLNHVKNLEEQWIERCF